MAAQSSVSAIYVIAPGGRTATGGMCRMVDYVMSEWESHNRRPPLVLVDSSGPYVKWKMPFYFAKAVARLTYDGLRGRIALLHIHTASHGSVVRKGLLIWLGQLLRVPVVVHMHSGYFVEFYRDLPSFLQRIITVTFRRADRFIVLGDSWRRFFFENVGLDPKRIRVIFNAVSGPAQYQPLMTLPERRRLVFAGLLIEGKGLSELLIALAKLTSWHLDVAGNGDSTPYRRQAELLGIGSQITFHGWLPSADLRRLLAVSHVVVLPSRKEALPMIIIEAMAYGLAVIATSVGAIPDVVTDGVSGLLVPPGNINALTVALATVIDDPDRCVALGAEARRRYQQDFEISTANDRIAATFAELLGQHQFHDTVVQ